MKIYQYTLFLIFASFSQMQIKQITIWLLLADVTDRAKY